MNLPNKLTVIRVVLAPVFLFALLREWYLAAAILFAVASFTDYLDGHLARAQGIVTNLGKFLDPLADKMLTTAAFLGFLAQGHVGTWAVMLILSREFMVTSVRLLAARDGTVVAAGLWGKIKTVTQIVAILVILATLCAVKGNWFAGVSWLSVDITMISMWIGNALVWVSVLFSWISGIQYFWQYRHLFKNK